MQILHTTPMQDKPDDPREQPVVERAPRVVPLKLITRTVIPARADDPMEALACSDVIARACEKWGEQTVARSFKCYLEGQERDIEGVTLDALAQGLEEL